MTDRYIRFATNTSNEFNHNDFLLMNDTQREQCHDFIQIVFPLAEPSKFNTHAPVIDITELRQAIIDDERIINTFMQSVSIMLYFWGIRYENGEFALDNLLKLNKLQASNHNTLRFSRLLRSLVYHDKTDIAVKLLSWILNQPVTPAYDHGRQKSYWEINLDEAINKVNNL